MQSRHFPLDRQGVAHVCTPPGRGGPRACRPRMATCPDVARMAKVFRAYRGVAGLTMIEVLVSTMVMASMLAALLSYVDSATKIWQRTDQTMTLSAEASQILDSLRFYSSTAHSVFPNTGSDNRITIRAFVATGTPGIPGYRTGVAFLSFHPEPGNPQRFVATYTAGSIGWGANQITFVSGNEALPQHVSLRRFTGVLTEHLASFSATRVGSGQMEIFLRLEVRLGDLLARSGPDYATPSYEIRSTLFIPPGW